MLVAVRDGRVHACGAPDEVDDAAFVRAVFGLDARVVEDPPSGTRCACQPPSPGETAQPE